MILALVIAFVVVLVLVVIWIVQTRPAKVPIPDEPCDTCGRWISGPRCRIVQEGTDSEDGISGGWAMVAYFHPSDECCQVGEFDPDHVHAR